MRRFAYQTVDVFTDRRFGGNPLAVFTDARGLSDAEMQALAAEMNYSETTFVLPPADPSNTARVRIFNRTSEMPFAGHPNVGTGCVLAALGRDRDGVLRFEELAGLVAVRVSRNAAGDPTGADIDAPQALTIGPALAVADAAACAGLSPADVLVGAHGPRWVCVGMPYYVAEVTRASLARAVPDVAAFQRLAASTGSTAERLALHIYARGEGPGVIAARMFAPLAGTWEDPATGSANAALAAYLLSLGNEPAAQLDITQGVEMGRPSRLVAGAARTAGGIRATIGGGTVFVFRGEAILD
jgi:trans-2,3-dihydro-3-hydroxyanthranilate isomerase